jgi:uncharacterized repeat protein (TIGR04002 family)
MWAPATIIIKMLISLPFTSKKDKIINVRNVVSLVIAAAISAVGYYLANAFLMGGFEGGLIAYLFSGNLVQSGGSAIVFVVLGLVLDKIGFKKRFLSEV